MNGKKKINTKDCVFCQIVAGKLASPCIRYEDKDIMALDDINPIAPIHVQVITKKHIESLDQITKKDEKLMGKALYVCKVLAQELGIAKNGYRVVTNIGKWGAQVIPHIHFHLIGGVPLTEDFAMYTEAKIDILSTKRI